MTDQKLLVVVTRCYGNDSRRHLVVTRCYGNDSRRHLVDVTRDNARVTVRTRPTPTMHPETKDVITSKHRQNSFPPILHNKDILRFMITIILLTTLTLKEPYYLQGARILTLEDGTDRLPLNVGKQLPLLAA